MRLSFIQIRYERQSLSFIFNSFSPFPILYSAQVNNTNFTYTFKERRVIIVTMNVALMGIAEGGFNIFPTLS